MRLSDCAAVVRTLLLTSMAGERDKKRWLTLPALRHPSYLNEAGKDHTNEVEIQQRIN